MDPPASGETSLSPPPVLARGGASLSPIRRSMLWLTIPRRISLRFSCGLVVAIAMAMAWEANQARVQRASVAAILRAGGSVHYDWGVQEGFAGNDPSWLEGLVRTLGVDHFASVTGADLRGATDALAPRIGALGRLDQLNLRGSPITDAGLEQLGGLTRLERLDLTHTGVTARGLANFRSMSNLKMLWLGGDSITSEGMETLKFLPNLELLSLVDTAVDDAGLEHLKNLKNLRDVSFARTKVTPEGLDALRRALPKAIIRP